MPTLYDVRGDVESDYCKKKLGHYDVYTGGHGDAANCVDGTAGV